MSLEHYFTILIGQAVSGQEITNTHGMDTADGDEWPLMARECSADNSAKFWEAAKLT